MEDIQLAQPSFFLPPPSPLNADRQLQMSLVKPLPASFNESSDLSISPHAQTNFLASVLDIRRIFAERQFK